MYFSVAFHTNRILNLEACHNVTDRGIQYLTSCNQLHKLVISYLDKVLLNCGDSP